MAFTDFATMNPVITETDYDRIRIHSGEGAYTENFNRSIRDSINRDAALEAAITYIARSSALYINETTELFVPCNNNGIDKVKELAPTSNIENPSSLFKSDKEFGFAEWTQSSITNIMAAAVDTRMGSFNGWSTNAASLSSSLGIKIDSSTLSGITVSNMKRESALGQANTTVSLTSSVVSIKNLTYPNNIRKISAGINVATTTDIASEKIDVKLNLILYNDSNSVLNTYTTILTNKNSYNGQITIDDISVPSDATKLALRIDVVFKEASSKGQISISNALVHTGSHCSSFVESSRPSCYAMYNDVLTLSPTGTECTVYAWTKFTNYGINAAENDIGPIFIKNNKYSIGIVHPYTERNVFTFCAYLNINGTVYKGNKVTVPSSYIDKYVVAAVRIRKNSEAISVAESNKYVIECIIIYKDNIYISSININNSLDVSTLAGNYSIVLGTDYTDTYKTAKTGHFNGPVTQIRLDYEWINDLELYVVALSNKKALYGADMTEFSEDITTIHYGVNLLHNPTGKQGLLGWSVEKTKNGTTTSYSDPLNISSAKNAIKCITGFSIEHGASGVGDCIIYSGNNTEEEILVSDKIEVSPSSSYSLSMYCSGDDACRTKIGIMWYDDDTNANSPVETVYIDASVVSENNYYSQTFTSNSYATHAKVVLAPQDGANPTIRYSKIKFERNEPTFYTDDTKDNVAFKTAYSVDEDDLVEIFGFDLRVSTPRRGIWGETLKYNWGETLKYNWGELGKSTI